MRTTSVTEALPRPAPRARAPSLPSTRATRSQVLNHEGWRNGSKQTTLVAILGAAGSDCTDDMLEVHSEAALRQLAGFQIGVLDAPNPCRCLLYTSPSPRDQRGSRMPSSA